MISDRPQIVCPIDMTLKLRFIHGLGDCVNFAHVLELYRRRGFQAEFQSDQNKLQLIDILEFSSSSDKAGANTASVPWYEAPASDISRTHVFGANNKAANNISRPPLPYIGTPEDLWDELLNIRIEVRSKIPQNAWDDVRSFLLNLPRPIVMLHTMGNTTAALKNLSPSLTVELYHRLLDSMDGSLILLDWDNRVPRINNYRVRHMTDDWQKADIHTLLALYFESDLLVAIDSGPLHLSRLTDTPAVGLFPTRHHHPTRFLLPRGNLVSIVPRETTHDLNLQSRLQFNIVESPTGERELDPTLIADTCLKMLNPPLYFTSDKIGSDIQFRQFIGWTRGTNNALSSYSDRHRGFDALFREAISRFPAPLIVETGCIRATEDWSGAGYGTYLLGTFVHRQGGELISVDFSADNCRFAREATSEMAACVRVVESDSVALLESFDRLIDVLYLDSMDTDLPGAAEHGLREIEAALPHLHAQSIVAFDDTVYSKHTFRGKGALAVPFLLKAGWRILYSGYQTILIRSEVMDE